MEINKKIKILDKANKVLFASENSESINGLLVKDSEGNILNAKSEKLNDIINMETAITLEAAIRHVEMLHRLIKIK